jgi:mono/diheme cytochrome c family protein
MCVGKPFMLALVLSAAVAMQAQEKAKIVKAPPPETDISSGAEMYHMYCAVCHGLDGKGGGPAAPALKQALPDLTLLSKKNGGKYPNFRVSNAIQGDASITAHGSRDMPMWGDVFRGMKRDEAVVKLRVYNLTQYIQSMQQK